MEFNLGEKMSVIFKAGNLVRIEKLLRKKDGVEYFNYFWSVDELSTIKWWGFETLEECVEDCITHLAIRSL